MIRSFKHKGLKRLYEEDDPRGVPPFLIDRLRLALARLNAVDSIQGMNFAGYRLHALKGNWKGYWSITLTGNRRMVFKFDEATNEAYEVALVDYH